MYICMDNLHCRVVQYHKRTTQLYVAQYASLIWRNNNFSCFCRYLLCRGAANLKLASSNLAKGDCVLKGADSSSTCQIAATNLVEAKERELLKLVPFIRLVVDSRVLSRRYVHALQKPRSWSLTHLCSYASTLNDYILSSCFEILSSCFDILSSCKCCHSQILQNLWWGVISCLLYLSCTILREPGLTSDCDLL